MLDDDIFEDHNIDVTWRRSGNLVVCEGAGVLPAKVHLQNGWDLQWLCGETYAFIENDNEKLS